jgi:hypothetical protein
MNDLSDEAFWTWEFDIHMGQGKDALCGWKECRRRAEAMLAERERKAFEAGRMSVLTKEGYERDNPKYCEEDFSAYQAAQEKAQ